MSDPEFLHVRPYLRYPDGDAAVDWLCRVFGFGPPPCVRNAQGRHTEGEIDVGPARVDISSGGTAAADDSDPLLIVGVTDVEATVDRIRSAGVTVDDPRQEDYGPRTCHVTDPWGHQWYFWQGQARYPPTG